MISKPDTNGISRNNLAVFLEPNFEDIMSVPDGMDPLLVHKADPTGQVPLIEERWKNGQTFEQFENATYAHFYEH